MSAHTKFTDIENKRINAKICGNVFHETKRAFVNVNNTATNVEKNKKKIQIQGKFPKVREKIQRIIPKKIPNTGQST